MAQGIFSAEGCGYMILIIHYHKPKPTLMKNLVIILAIALTAARQLRKEYPNINWQPGRLLNHLTEDESAQFAI